MEQLEAKDNPLPEYMIETLKVTGKQGQKMWNTQELEPGTYYYTLINAGQHKSGRIVIYKSFTVLNRTSKTDNFGLNLT